MAVMLANQHSIRLGVSTRELTKIFLSVLMITGAISFAYALGGGTTTGPAATQTSEAAGVASVSAVADAGTAEIDYLLREGVIDEGQYEIASTYIYLLLGLSIGVAIIAGSPRLGDRTKEAIIGCSSSGYIITSCARAA